MEPTARPQPRRARMASESPSSKRLWIALGIAAAVVVGFVVYYRFFLAQDRRHHELPVAWPAERGGGEFVRVGEDVKAGEVFLTTVEVASGLLLGFAQPDPMTGMRLDATVRVGHGITAAPDGGLDSTVKVVLHLISATYEPMRASVMDPLRRAQEPYVVRWRRGPKGRAPPETPRGDREQRVALDTLMAGLSDLTTNWLPTHEVRMGETWDVAEVADVLPRVEAILARAVGAVGPGYPKAAARGRVGAQALETRDGEPCLRLQLAISAEQQGEVGAPAAEGWLTGAGRVEGAIWVSTATGIVWGYEIDAELKASYVVPQRVTERHARQRIVARTARADAMPE